MTKYLMKSLDCQFITNRDLGKSYNYKWIIFPFFRVDRDKETKEIMGIYYCGWFSRKFKTIVTNIHNWDESDDNA